MTTFGPRQALKGRSAHTTNCTGYVQRSLRQRGLVRRWDRVVIHGSHATRAGRADGRRCDRRAGLLTEPVAVARRAKKRGRTRLGS
jgi:hypothetical protein